eukprot:CAMPEP_0113944484 /NCGR_PEP_ID=MMETSP1339-20121228/34452_1 /TAXON_ID=94617 /ORGANISM="Fibrocapsa japonica" /LENGTH=165 /DNA_ID=CAMNT_0000949703 /DNA_START=180 /DNA_END=677 /DNA_ORIENTATION=- /assembly_acc=CAM_ASM_000762
MSFEDERGALPPLGFWDPLGLSTDKSYDEFRQYRMAEIKHGRVAQLAVVGMLFQEFVRLPGYENIPNGIRALQSIPTPKLAIFFALIGYMELVLFKQEDDMAPGDVAGDFWKRYDDYDVVEDKLTKELQNGRLAMIAIMGMLAQNLVTGQTPIEQLLAGNISPFN